MAQKLGLQHASIRAAYDIACEAYAAKFIDELDHKPLDRELLKHFSTLVEPDRTVLDIGCGPGHTTAYLTLLGVSATGVDLSPKMIELASKAFPQTNFAVGNLFALDYPSSSIEGVLALYCIVHLSPDQLLGAFSEMFRVLRNGGVLLLSFHVGSGTVRADNFLETGATLDFAFFDPEEVRTALLAAGFHSIEMQIREPYEKEYPSQRCYVFARKPQCDLS